MTPYYTAPGVKIYNADCREILPELNYGAVVTDPPYGIGEAARKGRHTQSVLAEAKDYGIEDWDNETRQDVFDSLDKSKPIVWFGANYYACPPSPSWLIWDKCTGANDFADAELAWSNHGGAVRILRHHWQGMIRARYNGQKEYRHHPTQKPVPVMLWALGFIGRPTGAVLDPFMGSGTTLVAAKDLGLEVIGIERSLKYCEIAINRLQQETLKL